MRHLPRARLAVASVLVACVACGDASSPSGAPGPTASPGPTDEPGPEARAPHPSDSWYANPPADEPALCAAVIPRRCGCDHQASGGATGGVGLCQVRNADCAAEALGVLRDEALVVGQERCAGGRLRRITFDGVPDGTVLTPAALAERKIAFTSSPSCPPTVRVRDDGVHVLETCGAALGDAAFSVATGANVVAFVLDRTREDDRAAQLVLRAFRNDDPYRIGTRETVGAPGARTATGLVPAGQYAVATTFGPDEREPFVAFTPIWPDGIARLELARADACGPPDGGTDPAAVVTLRFRAFLAC